MTLTPGRWRYLMENIVFCRMLFRLTDRLAPTSRRRQAADLFSRRREDCPTSIPAALGVDDSVLHRQRPRAAGIE